MPSRKHISSIASGVVLGSAGVIMMSVLSGCETQQEQQRERRTRMNNMVLECKDGGNFEPHPEGIHPAVCVGCMDLGLVEEDYQGERSVKQKLKLTFESEATTKDGKRCTVSKKFTDFLRLSETKITWPPTELPMFT